MLLEKNFLAVSEEFYFLKTVKNYLKLLRFLKGHKKLFVIAVFLMLIASFFEVFNMSLLVPLFDIVFIQKEIIIQISKLTTKNKNPTEEKMR